MKLEMIIFDLDGTLWEVTECTYRTANEILRKHNISEEITMETIKNTMGYNFSEVAENYMPYFEKEKREQLLEEMLEYNNSELSKVGGNLYPDLEKTLKELNEKYKLAIVSNCGGGYIESFLESSKLSKYFVDFIAASQLKISKADAIRKVMDNNNINNAIYVGDTMKDFEASQGAGIEFIYAKYGFGKDLNTKYSMDFISQLPELLENIEQ